MRGFIGKAIDSTICLIEDLIDRVSTPSPQVELEDLRQSLGRAYLRMTDHAVRHAELEDENEQLRREVARLRTSPRGGRRPNRHPMSVRSDEPKDCECVAYNCTCPREDD